MSKGANMSPSRKGLSFLKEPFRKAKDQKQEIRSGQRKSRQEKRRKSNQYRD